MTSTTQVPRRGDPPVGLAGTSATASTTCPRCCQRRARACVRHDRRHRRTAIETSRAAAVAAITDLTTELLHLETASLDADVYVETQIDPSGSMSITRSSVGREVAFIVSHTIHHNAIVGQIMQARGLAVTPRFGLAPATPLDRGIVPCAQ